MQSDNRRSEAQEKTLWQRFWSSIWLPATLAVLFAINAVEARTTDGRILWWTFAVIEIAMFLAKGDQRWGQP